MARTKASQVEDQVTDSVTSEGNADAPEAPLSATVLAEIEAGKAALKKLSESQAAE